MIFSQLIDAVSSDVGLLESGMSSLFIKSFELKTSRKRSADDQKVKVNTAVQLTNNTDPAVVDSAFQKTNFTSQNGIGM